MMSRGLCIDMIKLKTDEYTQLKEITDCLCICGGCNLLGLYFAASEMTNKVLIDYIYPNHLRNGIHHKTRTLEFEPHDVSDVPIWDTTFCITPGKLQHPLPEVYVKPAAMFRDPFRKAKNKIVICDVWDDMHKPSEINSRYACAAVMEKVKTEEPWFGIEQEFFIIDSTGRPLNWSDDPDFSVTGLHTVLCGTSTAGLEREIVEAHYQACLYAGVKIHGINREDCPGQWEFQIGPCEGVTIGDHLWVARYILYRVVEKFRLDVTFAPSIDAKSYIGCGAHINFSTKKMREDHGIEYIEEAIQKISLLPQEKLLEKYDVNGGKSNAKRLSGIFYNPTTEAVRGVADKYSSTLRIPKIVKYQGFGFFEERRPAGDSDPYTVSETLVRAILIGDL